MKSIISLVCFLGCILAGSDTVWSHGVWGRTALETGILFEAEYDDGEPMSYAAVEVFIVNEELPFQTGRTDRNGRFLFLPDQPGDWKVVVKDEMGHRLAVKTIIDEDMNPKKTGGQTDRAADGGFFPKYEKAFTGLCLIFGISGVFFWWRGRRYNRRMNKAHGRPTESPNPEERR